jgi:hypothetical protein
MLSKMKRPFYQGVGRRNSTVEALRVDRVLKEAAQLVEEKARAARPQARAWTPPAGDCRRRHPPGQITPAQRQRAEKKAHAGRPARGRHGAILVGRVTAMTASN